MNGAQKNSKCKCDIVENLHKFLVYEILNIFYYINVWNVEKIGENYYIDYLIYIKENKYIYGVMWIHLFIFPDYHSTQNIISELDNFQLWITNISYVFI